MSDEPIRRVSYGTEGVAEIGIYALQGGFRIIVYDQQGYETLELEHEAVGPLGRALMELAAPLDERTPAPLRATIDAMTRRAVDHDRLSIGVRIVGPGAIDVDDVKARVRAFAAVAMEPISAVEMSPFVSASGRPGSESNVEVTGTLRPDALTRLRREQLI